MMKRNVPKVTLSLLSVLALVFLILAPAVPALAKSHAKPIVIHPNHFDLSQPLRDMVANELRVAPYGNHIIPIGGQDTLKATQNQAGAEDKALQKDVLPLVGTIPGLNFDGVGANGYAPPDTDGSVGTTQFFEMTNVEFAIYDKTSGNLLLGPALIHTIWSGFGGECESGDGGDPIVTFDKAADRWLVSQLPSAYDGWCVAISQTDDATGAYYRYDWSSPGGALPDYPKVGVWPDAYYMNTNTFGNGFSDQALACAFDRPSMLTGGAANQICFQTGANGLASQETLMPGDLDGSTPPASGAPNPQISLDGSTAIGISYFHVDFSNPANSTFTGPTPLTVDSYSQICGGFGDCVKQSGTSQLLEGLGRVMYRLAYRNFGDHEALVISHAITSGTSSGERWYEIRDPFGTPTIFQSGTFAPDSEFRWMGSMAMDQNGDIALGYSVSGSDMFPSIRYTGRVPGDPVGQMESENSIKEGSFFQSGLDRWGDYSDMSVDPIDDCTFWYVNQYQPSNGSFNWATRIASFKFVGCGSTTPDFYLTANPGSQIIFPGASTSYSATVNPVNGYSNTVSLSLTGCPSGATCSISPNSVGPPYNPSTLSVSTSGSIAPGNYTITITGTDGTLTHTTSVSLVVQDFSIAATPASISIKRGSSALYKATVTALNGFNGVVKFSVTGLPAKSTATFNPTQVTGHGNSNLTITTTKKTPIGSFTLSVTGTSGSASHVAKVTLNIVHKVK
jgi:hypothetical protein